MRCALAGCGFDVVEAGSGPEALGLLETVRPDVILLDVCMPGMSGLEVCRTLREREATRRPPVILVSAAADRQSIAEGFAAGAVDYQTKPFRAEELCARVSVHAQLGRARRELEASHARMAQLSREKDMMLGMVAHDLRGPLAVIMGFAENALSYPPGEAEGLARHALEVVMRETTQMNHFIGSLLDLNAFERGLPDLLMSPVNLVSEARAAVERAQREAARKGTELRLATPARPEQTVQADRPGLRRILDNFISNALKFTPSGGRVSVRLALSGREAQCQIHDTGPGLTADDQARAFGRFARLSAKPTAGEKSTGLGLAICRALAEGMGGRVWCANNPEGGATFAFALPLLPRDGDGRGEDPAGEGGADGPGGSAVPFSCGVGERAAV